MGADESKSIARTDLSGNTTIEFELSVKDIPKLASTAVAECIEKNIKPESYRYSFCLCLYPHGFNERAKNYVSLWLKKLTTDEILVQFTCSIVEDNGKRLCSKKTNQNLALESVLGWSMFCSRYVLIGEGEEALKDSNLKIKGKIEVFGSSAIVNANEDDSIRGKSLSEMSDNFRQLLVDHHFSDFDIKVGHRRLRAHKAVLSARSAVFKTMFQSRFQQNTKEMTITDITYEGVEMLMKYIYTGKLDYLSVPIAMEVYYAADKYEVFMLRNICSRILSKNLLSDNVIDILMLGFRHSDIELQESCLRFMDKNLREIKGRPEWIDLMRKHPDLADKALFFSRN